MKTIQNDHYAYREIWSEEDNEYVGLCVEFPGLSWLAHSPEEALHGIRKVVAEVIDDMQQSGEAIPEPLASKQYSGRFIIRVPPEVHRMLALEAAESGVSLNRLASARLTHSGNTISCTKREIKQFSQNQSGVSRIHCNKDHSRLDRSVRMAKRPGKSSTEH